MPITAAQVAKLAELSGNWTEPLHIRCAEMAMLDDGRIRPANELEGVVPDARCLVIAVQVTEKTWRAEKLVGPDLPPDPKEFM